MPELKPFLVSPGVSVTEYDIQTFHETFEPIVHEGSDELTLREAKTLQQVRNSRPALPPLPPYNHLYDFSKLCHDQQARDLAARYLQLNPSANIMMLYQDLMCIHGIDGMAEFKQILTEDIATIELAQQKEYQHIFQKWDDILNNSIPIKVVANSRRIAVEYWFETNRDVNDNLFDLSSKTTLQDLV